MATQRNMMMVLILVCIHGPYSIISASEVSIGPLGINSAVLEDHLDLTGEGVGIGQIENKRPGLPERPGFPAFDGVAYTHSTVIPAAVFEQDTGAIPNTSIEDHAEQVAGILISTDPVATGVAVGASLYAAAHSTGIDSFPSSYDATLLTIQNVCKKPNVRALNHSYGKDVPLGGEFNGNSQLTLGLD